MANSNQISDKNICLSIATCLVLLLSFGLQAQEVYRPFSTPDLLQIDSAKNKLREKILSHLPDEYLHGEHARSSYLFADYSNLYTERLLKSERIYNSWGELDEYLRNIIKNVIPDSIFRSSDIRIAWVRNGSFNASMSVAGVMQVNIGVWNHLDSEAALAALVAHEVAHYYLDHSFEWFRNNVEGKHNFGMVKNQKGALRESRKRELQADSLGHQWILDSEYSYEGSQELIRILERQEAYYELRREFDLKEKKSTHPLSDNRINLMKEIRMRANEKGHSFLQSDSLFWKLKSEAIPELIRAHLVEREYISAIESAFKYHLFYPDSSIYTYYLMESIRRLCYEYPMMREENFIVSIPHHHKLGPTTAAKSISNQHLFEKFDPKILSMSPSEYRRIAARFYWEGEARFRTYREAFMFFAQVGEVLGCAECELVNALHYFNNDSKRKQSLRTYLEQDDPRLDSVASRLVKGELVLDLPEKKLTILNVPLVLSQQGKEFVPINPKGGISNEQLRTAFSASFSKYPDRVFMFQWELLKNDPENYRLIRELEALGEFDWDWYEKNPDIALLDPTFLSVFLAYGVNEIEFIDFIYTEHEGKSKSLEDYLKASEISFGEVLEKRNGIRYVEPSLKSARIDDRGASFFSYAGQEVQIPKEESGQEAFSQRLEQFILKKDEYMVHHKMNYKLR